MICRLCYAHTLVNYYGSVFTNFRQVVNFCKVYSVQVQCDVKEKQITTNMGDSQLTPLELEALKRHDKLRNLKRKLTEHTDNKTDGKPNSLTLPTPKFRSYKPRDKNLEEHSLEKPAIADSKTEVKDLLELSKSEMVIDQLDISTLAPRQPDWDLKRAVAKKLEKLERRTQRAMAELIRERLKEKQDLAELASSEDSSYTKQ